MGIDYGLGQTNIDRATGIRYGVISSHEVTQAWADSSESEYGDPTCPKCGNEAADAQNDDVERDGYERDRGACGDYACDRCRYLFDGEDAFGDEPIGWSYSDEYYVATQSGSDHDIFITRSPYYTLCEFCSPCAPGAGYLLTPGPVKAYCFGHDWFDGDVAPYTVYRVADDVIMLSGVLKTEH